LRVENLVPDSGDEPPFAPPRASDVHPGDDVAAAHEIGVELLVPGPGLVFAIREIFEEDGNRSEGPPPVGRNRSTASRTPSGRGIDAWVRAIS
jgi:hypothetical protein